MNVQQDVGKNAQLTVHRIAQRLSSPRAPFKLYRNVKVVDGKRIVLRAWWVRFTAPGPDGQPKQFRIGLGTEDRSLAQRLAIQAYSKRLSEPVDRPTGDPALSEFLPEYHKHLKATKAGCTARNQWYVVRGFFADNTPNWTTTKLSRITPDMIARYITRRRIQDRLSPWSLFEIRKCLSALFSHAQARYGFPANPAAKAAIPRRSTGSIVYLKRFEIPQVLETVRDQATELYAPVAIGILAGLRRSEIIWLTWQDVDLKRRLIQVRFKTAGGDRYVPKTGRSRIVPISKELLSILEAVPRKSEWVCPTPTGKRWLPNNLGNRLREIMQAGGWKHGFNTFRHTFGSQLAQKGMSLYKISQLMGNSEEVCREHYAAVATDEMQEDVSFL